MCESIAWNIKPLILKNLYDVTPWVEWRSARFFSEPVSKEKLFIHN